MMFDVPQIDYLCNSVFFGLVSFRKKSQSDSLTTLLQEKEEQIAQLMEEGESSLTTQYPPLYTHTVTL